jgi:hypothetical protein
VNELDLLDWRRRVAELYAAVRAAEPAAGWELWRTTRDALFASHPQSPIPAATAFNGLPLFDYDPGFRVLADVRAAEPTVVDLAAGDGATYRFTRFAVAAFDLEGARALDLHWLHGYAGGVFLSFTDATSGDASYGGGRYLLDTIKGADLGGDGGRVWLDFNFAYNPSCAYDPRWSCPLPSGVNRLTCRVAAGEQAPNPHT